MKLKEITDYLESFAPLALQESYDNAGLLVGSPDLEVSGAIICLDSTEAVIDEALANHCNLIIAHHPIVFSGIKKLNGKNYIERVIIKAIQNNIAIYAAHTNLDNIQNGVNAKIAEKLGLINCKILAPQKGSLRKLVTYCPADKAEEVRNALFAAGGGHIGNYDQCSFNSSGIGTFRANHGTNPYVGEVGKQHRENETKIELVYHQLYEKQLIVSLLAAHPYEEVAYDIIPLGNKHASVGAGLIGELPEESKDIDFLKQLKQVMKAGAVRYTALENKKVRKIAVCGGSGSFLLQDAIAQRADVFVTADFKYHQFFDADGRIVIADIGHYESEQYTSELFYEVLKKKFSTFALLKAKTNTNPINYL